MKRKEQAEDGEQSLSAGHAVRDKHHETRDSQIRTFAWERDSFRASGLMRHLDRKTARLRSLEATAGR